MIEAFGSGSQIPGANGLYTTLSLLLADPRPFDVHCNAGIHQYAVSTRGDLYPCHMFVGAEEMYMGNIFEDRVLEGERMRQVRERLLQASKSAGGCSKCWSRNLCLGCVARCYHESGDPSFQKRANCGGIRASLETVLGELAKVSESPDRWANLLRGLGGDGQERSSEKTC